jgi:D-lactate dehydrogenase (cytochrome)
LGAECTELINLEKKMGLAVSPTLFMEFHGPSRKHLAEILEIVREICHDESCRDFRPGLEKSERDSFFQARHELGEMIIRRHPDCGILSLDVAVPISAYPEMMAAGRSAIARTGLAGYTFSHAGDGNIHLVLAGRKGEKADWDLIEQVSARMVGKALQMGGTATGEHGVGIGKRRFMPEEHGCALGWMKKLKQLFDPAGILNPGKIFPCSLQGGPRSEADTHS